ncbi:hypothetical protein LEP1GSC026_3190 [Leptospira interrogans str. 2002000623]|uniref:Uncharacterized protein n=2 Tax=Leptospira interrogans TaxID=173 RepID=A0A829DBI7_LEPIR|nr:hypothetical protein LEP1GSC027_3997 [Leptospira interrogans str. 2002000624]EKQ46005.1 hypothetical protein LEP1GSC026_3190 [Leptospira interrogans str. 2002000623]EMY05606.1 hypothetical protein LEP1GSC029_0224 [Leptospira interrogans str. 2002000626]EMY22358.1 hypothetical protein LEP1GSC115_1918 [Leptospira interrogans serovar Australis str. 200703203]
MYEFLHFLSPPYTERTDTQERLNRNVGKSRENRLFEGVLEGFSTYYRQNIKNERRRIREY